MSSRKRCGSFLVGVLLVAANLFVFNWLARGHYERIDLTRDRLYTLHPATLELLADVDDLVTLRVYLSQDRFEQNQSATEVPVVIRDIVEEFVAESRGRIKAIFIDPTGDEAKASEAISAGVPELEMRGIEEEQAKVFKVFLGMVASYGGKPDQVIPQAWFPGNEYRLELELALAIRRLTQRETITVGVNSVSTLPPGVPPEMAAQFGGAQDKWDIDSTYRLLRDELKKTYEVEKVRVDQPIPEHVQLLVLANTDGLDDKARFYVDQYLMGGGQIVVVSSGVDLDQRSASATARGGDNDEWFRHYGFTIEKNLVFDRVTVPSSPFEPPPYYAPLVLDRNFDAESTLMTGVPSFALPICSSIQLNPPEGVTAVVLAHTTPRAWQQTGFFTLDPSARESQPPTNPEDYRTFDVVGLLEGRFRSYFENRKLPEGISTAAKEPTAQDVIDRLEAGEGTLEAPAPGDAPVPHDHDGDGKADHGDDAHSSDGTGGGGSGGSALQDAPPAPQPPVGEPAAGESEAAAAEPPAAETVEDETAREDGADEEPLGGVAPTLFVKAQSPSTRIVVIGSNLLLTNGILQSFPGSAEFFLTIVERMTTGSRLAELRNRSVQRPTLRADLSTGAKTGLKWFGILGMPVIVAIFGVLFTVLRKSRRKMGVAA
jgi:ABC-type uncharacterized transport system involved in gliding motility auxiliary subunit